MSWSALLLVSLLGVSIESSAASSGIPSTCGKLSGCYLQNVENGKETKLTGGELHRYTVNPRDNFSIRCEVEGRMNKVFFFFPTDRNGSLVIRETGAPYWMNGDSPGWINRVKYLRECGTKIVPVIGYVDEDNEHPCFVENLLLEADCAPTPSPTLSPTTAPTAKPTLPQTEKPTSSPTEQPVVAPTEAPVVAPTEAPVVAPTEQPVAAPEDYEISVSFSNVPKDDQPFFHIAVNRWQSVVSEGLLDIPSQFLGDPVSGCTYPEVIDDLFLCAIYDLVPSDGPGGVLAFAGPAFWRLPSFLPISGGISIDSQDVERLKQVGLFDRLILHELGHVLGIGTQWENTGVTGAISENCPYFGPSANAEYKAITGCDDVPTELDGGSGTRCRHWDEVCLGSELMTGFVGGRTQLSRITIGSLEDLGYTVDYSTADYLGPDDIHPECFCNERRSLFEREHGEVTQLNHPLGKTRRLSDETKAMALAKGAEILEIQHEKLLAMGNDIASDAVGYAADKIVSVIVEEGDGLFGLIVHRDD